RPRGAGCARGGAGSGASRPLSGAGQAATAGDGRPTHPGDMGAQLGLAVDNLEAVLREAGMTLADLGRVAVYTTDVDALMPEYGVLAGRLAAAGVAPTTTMLQVERLAIPGLMVELEAIAVA